MTTTTWAATASAKLAAMFATAGEPDEREVTVEDLMDRFLHQIFLVALHW